MTRPPNRLPVPDWTRPGETWRVEEEPGWILRADYMCSALKDRCLRRAVAVRPRGEHYALCDVHLRAGLMWIENGQVVSWAIRP